MSATDHPEGSNGDGGDTPGGGGHGVPMELHRIIINENADQQVIQLKELDGERRFPIVIGSLEAVAIHRRLLGETPERPLTHDLLASVVDHLGGRVERIVITRLEAHTFYARVHLRDANGGLKQVDSRPSDAIALGVATMVPIFVAEKVLDEVC